MIVPIEGPTFGWKCTDKQTTKVTSAALATKKSRTFADAITDPKEKLVGANNLRPISFLEKGIQISRSVAHITIPGEGVATGFLISEDVLLTNNHVFATEGDALKAIVRFNYQHDLEGNLLQTEEFQCDPLDLFHTNGAGLDYTIVRIKGSPGFKWGYIHLSKKGSMHKGSDVLIIQHPGGLPKQIALTDNEVMYKDTTIIQYLTDTMPGSSGSPVFDDRWRLVALHHSGGWIPEPTSNSTHFRNEGIRISAIMDDMATF